MIDQINQVKEFHRLTENNWIENVPQLPSQARKDLRVNLVMEEAHEFELAIKENDLVEAADGLIDTIFVAMGSLGELGLAEIAVAMFDEVTKSNMSKLCNSEDEANATVLHYANVKNTEARYKLVDDNKFLVYRVSDGKTLKSINYKPADLKFIINQQIKLSK